MKLIIVPGTYYVRKIIQTHDAAELIATASKLKDRTKFVNGDIC